MLVTTNAITVLNRTDCFQVVIGWRNWTKKRAKTYTTPATIQED
jgi:hypothetical protein